LEPIACFLRRVQRKPESGGTQTEIIHLPGLLSRIIFDLLHRTW
jgi:hypothetical protein